MINKNYIHLLNYFASKNLLTGESKLVFKSGSGDFEIISSREKKEDMLKRKQADLAQALELTRNYEEGFDKYFTKTISMNVTKSVRSGRKLILDLVGKFIKSTPKKVTRTPGFKKFVRMLPVEFEEIFQKNKSDLGDNMPFAISLEKGGIIRFHNKKGFDLAVNIRQNSTRLRARNNLRESVRKLREELKVKKQEVVKKTQGQLKDHKKDVQHKLEENPTANFDQLLSKENGKYLVKSGKGYIVKFLSPRGMIDRKAEKETTINDLFDFDKLAGGNIHITMEVEGVTPNGRRFKHFVVYHPGARKLFIKEGNVMTSKRPRVFHDTKITNIKYEVGKVGIEEEKPTVAKPGAKTVLKPKAGPKGPSDTELMRQRDAGLAFVKHREYIFDNKQFDVPASLQHDENWNKNWKFANQIIDRVLNDPPFGPMSTPQRRKYLQDVIQDWKNSRLYAEDFFKTKLAGGRELYAGGYKKFLKDFKENEELVDKRAIDIDKPVGKEEKAIVEKFLELEKVSLALGRIFEALDQLRSGEVIKVDKETRINSYRNMFLGMAKIEKEPKGTKYHSLESLLHKKEKAPKGMHIGVTDAVLYKIQQKFMDRETDDFDPSELLKSKGGLKLLFMTFGLRQLIAEGCLKQVKNDPNKFVLVKLPDANWNTAAQSLNTEKAKLWDHSKDNFAKWEKIRASLSKSAKARLFIKTIFDPGNGTVKQNFNWWQGMWHGRAVWKKEQKISMAFLGKISINPSEFEKFMTAERGYIDMIEKTSKRVEGTSLFEPNENKVLNRTNRYIQYGILSILENVPKGEKRRKAVDKLVTDLGIKSSLGLDVSQEMDEFAQKPTLDILDEIFEEVELRNIDPKALKSKKGLIKLIRVGFVIGRKIETAEKWQETMGNYLSRKPLYKKIQLEALKRGCPLNQLKDIEGKLHLAIFGGARTNPPHFVKVGAGGAISLQLFKTKGHSMSIALGVFGRGPKNVSTQIIPFGSVNARIKAGEKVHIRFSIGASPSFAGAGVAIEFPITKTWDMYAGASAGAAYKKGVVGGSIGIGARYNQGKHEKLEITKGLKKLKSIDDAIKAPNVTLAAKLILRNPDIGGSMQGYQKIGNLNDQSVVDLYVLRRPDYINKIRAGIKIPAVVGFGANVFISNLGAGVGAYITFKVPGTEVTYVVRHAHSQYNEYIQSKAAQADLAKQLRKEGIKKFKIASYVIKANSEILYFDSNYGRSQVGSKREKGPTKPVVAKRTNHQVEKFSNSHELVKKTFAKLGMHVEKVKDPKNPKGFLLALTPLQTTGSNIEVLMDPALASKGLIMDKANNRFLIAADVAKNLYITRSTYRYPFKRRGAMNLQVISFKANPSTSNADIRKKSPYYLYKYAGAQYKRMNGENRTESRVRNVMTVAEYARTKRKYETYNEISLDFSREKGQEKSRNLRTAISLRTIEEVRANRLKLAKFGDWLHKGRPNRTFQRDFSRGIGSIKNPDQENRFKTTWFKNISAKFIKFRDANNLGDAILNEQEKNLIYAYLLDKNFTKLRTDKTHPGVVTKRLKIRNELFRKYMRKYINGFIRNNPTQWAEIRKKFPKSSKEGVLRFLLLCMPQNSKDLDKFFKRKSLPLEAGLKYASYTHRHGVLEAMPTGFGADVKSKAFRDVLRLVGPTRLNINSKNPNERVAANLVLRMMSPLPTSPDKLKSAPGKVKFLQSELSLLLMSMFDKTNGISPLIQVLGVKNFDGLTKIMEAIKSKDKTKIKNALGSKIGVTAFKEFKTIVLGIRKAQLDGKAVFLYKNKFKFFVTRTEIYAGPYLKCGNGTVAVKQQIGIQVMGAKEGRLYAGRTDLNIITGTEERKAYGKLTVGIYTGMKFKAKRRPTKKPPSREVPPPDGDKGNPAGRIPSPAQQPQTPAGGAAPKPHTDASTGEIA